MTTIAIDKNYVLATDSRLTAGDRVVSENAVKAFKYKGKWITYSGDIPEVFEYLKLCRGSLNHFPSLRNEDGDYITNILILSKNKLESVEESSAQNLHLIELDVPYASGSGGDVALGAMLAGKSAKQAVLIASKVDIKTNSNVVEYLL